MDGERFDVVVVGSGIVGLAHALVAQEQGASVAVVERDPRPVGASIRNFGHACVTAQDGVALDRALRARRRWLALATDAGFWAAEVGTAVVARAADELAVLEELRERRGAEQVAVLGPEGLRALVPTTAPDVVGGANFPLDLRVDPREAVPAIARWLAERPGVRFLHRTNCLGVGDATVRTNRGDLKAGRVVLCVGHDVDHLLPDVADRAAVRRCRLQMLRVRPPSALRIGPAVLSGLSMLRYAAFAACPSLAAVRERLVTEQPAAIGADVNLMMTQLPGGDLLLGDTHERDLVTDPFHHEDWDDLLLAEGARLLGLEGPGALPVVERWQGVYASAPEEFLVETPRPGLDVVSVTTGIGMTTALGLAEDVAARW